MVRYGINHVVAINGAITILHLYLALQRKILKNLKQGAGFRDQGPGKPLLGLLGELFAKAGVERGCAFAIAYQPFFF